MLKISEKSALVRDCDGLYVVETQDVTALGDANADQRTQKPNLRGQRHVLEVARMPTSLYMALRRKFGPMKHAQAEWRRWLNDPDNRLFRTWHGNL